MKCLLLQVHNYCRLVDYIVKSKQKLCRNSRKTTDMAEELSEHYQSLVLRTSRSYTELRGLRYGVKSMKGKRDLHNWSRSTV